jgi:cell division control protein 24
LPDARGLVPVAFFQALGKTERSERITRMYPLGSTTPIPPHLTDRRFLAPVTATSTRPPIRTQIKARVQCQGNYVALVISTNITYQSLIDRIDAKVGRFSINSFVKGTLKLRYCDDDGDNVTISNDDDLQLALNEAMHRQVKREAIMEGRLGEVDFSCFDCQPT